MVPGQRRWIQLDFVQRLQFPDCFGRVDMGGKEEVDLSRMEPKMQFSHTRLNSLKLGLTHSMWEKKHMKKTSSKKKARWVF